MAGKKNIQGSLDEMSIVDIFTKLIFDAQTPLNDSEALIYQLLIHYDETLLEASRRDISEYLRSMAVDEMIKVVAVLKAEYEKQQGLLSAVASRRDLPVHR